MQDIFADLDRGANESRRRLGTRRHQQGAEETRLVHLLSQLTFFPNEYITRTQIFRHQGGDGRDVPEQDHVQAVSPGGRAAGLKTRFRQFVTLLPLAGMAKHGLQLGTFCV